MATYEPRSDRKLLTSHEWLTFGWASLPENRIELSGETKEPLVVQYAGETAGFANALAEDGWKPAPEWSLTTASGFVVGQTPAEKLPALPRTQNGRQPALILIKNDHMQDPQSSRWILRLWPSRYQVLHRGSLLPLYTGSVLHEEILRPMGEFSGPKIDREEPALADNPALLVDGAAARTRTDGTEVVLALEPPASPVSSSDKPRANSRGR
ncbi:MAG: LssY C-terminal domain-containing protein, partial [Roseibium sp.]